jgi:hypothetical protein
MLDMAEKGSVVAVPSSRRSVATNLFLAAVSGEGGGRTGERGAATEERVRRVSSSVSALVVVDGWSQCPALLDCRFSLPVSQSQLPASHARGRAERTGPSRRVRTGQAHIVGPSDTCAWSGTPSAGSTPLRRLRPLVCSLTASLLLRGLCHIVYEQASTRATTMSASSILHQWAGSPSCTLTSSDLALLRTTLASHSLTTADQLHELTPETIKSLDLELGTRQRFINELKLLRRGPALPQKQRASIASPPASSAAAAAAASAVLSPSDMFTAAAAEQPFSPADMFPLLSAQSVDDPFSLALTEEPAGGDDEELFRRPSARQSTTNRKKRESLFDDDDDDSNTASSIGGPSASPDAPLEDLDSDLERVLAAFSPDGRPDSSPVDAAPFISTRDTEDDFDRAFLTSASRAAVSANALFGDDLDDQDDGDAGNKPQASPSVQRKLEDQVFTVKELDELTNTRKPRRLRLTATELQTLQLDGSVSKAFSYSDIFCITCTSHDGGTVSISFISDADQSFSTPDARALASELNERLARCRRIEAEGGVQEEASQSGSSTAQASSAVSTLEQHAHTYQQRLFALTGDDASHASGSANPEQAVFFTPGFTPASSTTAGKNASTTRPAATAASSTANDQSSTAAVASTSSSSARRRSSSAAYQTWHRQYLLDQQIQSRIDAMWLTPGTEEAKARAKFLKAFPGMETKAQAASAAGAGGGKAAAAENLLTATRRFLDSFAAYMEKKRIDELRKELVHKPAPPPADGIAEAKSTAPASDTTAATPASSGLLTDRDFSDTFHARVERSAEVAVLMPVLPRLLAYASGSAGGAEADAAVLAQLEKLKGRSQSHFGIPLSHQSPSSYSRASRELLHLAKFALPTDKLQVLLGTAKAVYETFQQEAPKRREAEVKRRREAGETISAAEEASLLSDFDPSKLFLPADDLFPIFVWVVAQTPLQQPCTLRTMMWALCDKQALQGEAGYYLTVWDSALEYLKKVDVTQPMHGPNKAKTKAGAK